MRTPAAPLLAAILDMATDPATDTDARILVVRAHGAVMPSRTPVGVPGAFEPAALTAVLEQQTEAPEAPVPRFALEQASERIGRRSLQVPV